MPEDFIRYDLLTQTALRGVMRTVLADVAKKGLPGEHHFKITFMTTAPGVRLPERVRAQYPQTMTIILQHQFWDLTVREEAFDVGLAFSGIPERLTVPFEAVSAFFDPAVQFGFQFETAETTTDDAEDSASGATEKSTKPASRRSAESKKADALRAPEAKEETPNAEGGEVVSLDRFRKK
ncbi:MAG TPA: ClpXP protease specificity-enhancing factor SspB [Xanthobacteraceae bacterium]|nr:ClpXP protease specificity-enhancing factor SspB [Xanthobacteraceae bacterium]